jgi:hypothetical protein
MKKKYVGLLMMIIGIYSACSVGQEFIKQKTKKVYVSEQQCIELDGEIVVCGTDAQGALAELLKTIFSVVKNALNRVGNHVNGEKSGLNKIERTDCYTKKVKIKEELERCITEIQKMQQRIDELIAILE